MKVEKDLDVKSTGDESAITGPTNVKAGKRRGDKDQGDKKPIAQGSSVKPMSKMAKIGTAAKAMSTMSEEEIDSILDAILENIDQEEIEDNNDQVELKVTSDDIDVSEDLEAIFNGIDFNDDTKKKIATVFEAAVLNKVNEQLEYYTAVSETTINEGAEKNREELEQRLDAYLDYVVEQWMEDNQLAVDSGIRAELAESFLQGLHTLFAEHYVNVPEDKTDVVEEISNENVNLRNQLNNAINQVTNFKQQMQEMMISNLVSEQSYDLTAVQRDKLNSLVEAMTFDTMEEAAETIGVLKEQYFGEPTTTELNFDDDDVLNEEVDDTVKISDPTMRSYYSSLERTVRHNQAKK